MARIADRLDPDSLEQGLSTLLNNLRIAGLPVYPRDIERINQACRLAPPTHRQGFLTLIQCTLATNPKEQDVVAEQFDLWWRRTASWVEGIENPETFLIQSGETIEKETGKLGRPGKKTRSTIPRKSAAERWRQNRTKRPGLSIPLRKWRKWWRHRWLMILSSALFCLAMVAVFSYFWSEGQETPISPPEPASIQKPLTADPAFKPVDQYYAWAPEKIEVTQRDQSLPLLLSVLLAGVPLGFWVVYRYRRSTTRPPEAVVPWQGPSWRPLLPEYQQVSLLQPDELRRSAWAVERFSAEQPTRRLDIGRTVAATCREGGIPVL